MCLVEQGGAATESRPNKLFELKKRHVFAFFKSEPEIAFESTNPGHTGAARKRRHSKRAFVLAVIYCRAERFHLARFFIDRLEIVKPFDLDG